MIPDEKVRRAHLLFVSAVMAEPSQLTSAYAHPIDTDVPASEAQERTTPRAQTRQEVEEEGREDIQFLQHRPRVNGHPSTHFDYRVLNRWLFAVGDGVGGVWVMVVLGE